MPSFGSGMYVDVDNDEDDMLVMEVSSLYNASMPKAYPPMKGADASWFRSNIHRVNSHA